VIKLLSGLRFAKLEHSGMSLIFLHPKVRISGSNYVQNVASIYISTLKATRGLWNRNCMTTKPEDSRENIESYKILDFVDEYTTVVFVE
jgi:hypothetical protein